MKVYFAHCKNEYGTDLEKAILAYLKTAIAGEIVNPSDPAIQNTCVKNNMSYWKGVVRQCDWFLFKRYQFFITAGVGQEMEIAFEKGMTVYEVLPKSDGTCMFLHCEKMLDYLNLEATRRLMYPDRYK